MSLLEMNNGQNSFDLSPNHTIIKDNAAEKDAGADDAENGFSDSSFFEPSRRNSVVVVKQEYAPNKEMFIL